VKLYHYTTIEKLALILKNRTIRFNSTKNVDDPRESDSFDLGKLEHYFLISCWTTSEAESISMWKMYSDLQNGCIIKLDSDMFNDKVGSLNNKIQREFVYKSEKVEIRPGKEFLIEVDYKKNYQKKQFYYLDKKDGIDIDDYSIIKIKSEEWAFQKEWRYVLYQMLLPESKNGYLGNELIDKITDLVSYDCDHFDLEIDKDEFERMEIISAPLMSEGAEIIIKNLCRQYNSKATITNSKCKIAI